MDSKWQISTRSTLPCHFSTVHTVRWSPEGSHLASSGNDTVIHLHRATESGLVMRTEHSTKKHTGRVCQLSWNTTDSNQLVSASMDQSVKVWDLRHADPIATTKLARANVAVDWSVDGRSIAVQDESGSLAFLDATMGFRVFKELKLNGAVVGDIAWNRDNDLLLVASADGQIHVLDKPSLNELMTIEAFTSACGCIRSDATGKHFAVGSNDAISSIWDAENLACIVSIDRLWWPIQAISFSHDGAYLASGAQDHFIDIADVVTGEQVASIKGESSTLALDFHPKDLTLAYALHGQTYQDVGNIQVVRFAGDTLKRAARGPGASSQSASAAGIVANLIISSCSRAPTAGPLTKVALEAATSKGPDEGIVCAGQGVASNAASPRTSSTQPSSANPSPCTTLSATPRGDTGGGKNRATIKLSPGPLTASEAARRNARPRRCRFKNEPDRAGEGDGVGRGAKKLTQRASEKVLIELGDDDDDDDAQGGGGGAEGGDQVEKEKEKEEEEVCAVLRHSGKPPTRRFKLQWADKFEAWLSEDECVNCQELVRDYIARKRLPEYMGSRKQEKR